MMTRLASAGKSDFFGPDRQDTNNAFTVFDGWEIKLEEGFLI
jgi:hypothetical protein